MIELNEQALLDVAGGHAGWVERLHHGQDLLHVLGGRLAALRDLLDLRAQVAVLVEVADDLLADAPHERVVGRIPQLFVEMVGERVDRADHVLERQILAVFLRHQGALLVIVEHHRRQIERQVVGLALRGRRRRRLAAEWLGRRRGGHVRRGLPIGGVRRLRLHLFEQRVFAQLLLDDFLQLERAELQQLDRLLQQRGHDDPLALSKGESGFHCHRRFSCPRTYSANFSPR
jgi:hypothetical protein